LKSTIQIAGTPRKQSTNFWLTRAMGPGQSIRAFFQYPIYAQPEHRF
jgi:hypothetical protein